MKKRGGTHERTIREFRLDGRPDRVGELLRNFRGILTGVPVSRAQRGHCRTGRPVVSDRRGSAPRPARSGPGADQQGRVDCRGAAVAGRHRLARSARPSRRWLASSRWRRRRADRRRKRRRPPTRATLARGAREPAAVVRSAGPRADAAGRRFGDAGRGRPDARQRRPCSSARCASRRC